MPPGACSWEFLRWRLSAISGCLISGIPCLPACDLPTCSLPAFDLGGCSWGRSGIPFRPGYVYHLPPGILPTATCRLPATVWNTTVSLFGGGWSTFCTTVHLPLPRYHRDYRCILEVHLPPPGWNYLPLGLGTAFLGGWVQTFCTALPAFWSTTRSLHFCLHTVGYHLPFVLVAVLFWEVQECRYIAGGLPFDTFILEADTNRLDTITYHFYRAGAFPVRSLPCHHQVYHSGYLPPWAVLHSPAAPATCLHLPFCSCILWVPGISGSTMRAPRSFLGLFYYHSVHLHSGLECWSPPASRPGRLFCLFSLPFPGCQFGIRYLGLPFLFTVLTLWVIHSGFISFHISTVLLSFHRLPPPFHFISTISRCWEVPFWEWSTT